MIKSELISLMAKAEKFSHLSDSENSDNIMASCINCLIDAMSDALCRDDRIEIRGFGSFSLHYRAPRKAHNPKTGVKVLTIAKYSPHFKPGKELRERVNQQATAQSSSGKG